MLFSVVGQVLQCDSVDIMVTDKALIGHSSVSLLLEIGKNSSFYSSSKLLA